MFFFSELGQARSAVTIKSDIGNAILRQSPIGTDGMAARPVTWVEKGLLRNLVPGQPATVNQSLVQEGHFFQHVAMAYDMTLPSGLFTTADVQQIEHTRHL